MLFVQKLKTARALARASLRGWRCRQKIVVIESDDWGGIRTSSREAYDRLIEAVRLCSVCVTFFSTTALEAFVWRKPLVLIQCVNTWHVLEYGSQYGAALEAKKPEDIEPAIVSAATDPEVQERLRRGAEAALQKELFGLDGQSSRRMAESVIGLIEQRRGKD